MSVDYRMPIYIQLQDIILKKIEEKTYLPGEAIPSERKLAETYGVNRMTVKRAIEKLVEQGYLVRRPGAGTFVNRSDEKKLDLGIEGHGGNEGISAQLRQKGMKIESKVIGEGDVENSRYLNYKLAIPKEEVVWGLHRVRIGDNMPFAVEYTYVPKACFEDAEEFDFTKVSLYDYMESKGHLPVKFGQKFVVCEANEKIANLLGVERGTSIFKVEYQGADENGKVVEYTISYLNSSYTKFDVITDC